MLIDVRLARYGRIPGLNMKRTGLGVHAKVSQIVIGVMIVLE